MKCSNRCKMLTYSVGDPWEIATVITSLVDWRRRQNVPADWQGPTGQYRAKAYSRSQGRTEEGVILLGHLWMNGYNFPLHLRCLLVSSTEPHLEWRARRGAYTTKLGFNSQATRRAGMYRDLRTSLCKDALPPILNTVCLLAPSSIPVRWPCPQSQGPGCQSSQASLPKARTRR